MTQQPGPFHIPDHVRKILDRLDREEQAAKNDLGAHIVMEICALMQSSRNHAKTIAKKQRWIEKNIAFESDEVRLAVQALVADYVAKVGPMFAKALADLEIASAADKRESK